MKTLATLLVLCGFGAMYESCNGLYDTNWQVGAIGMLASTIGVSIFYEERRNEQGGRDSDADRIWKEVSQGKQPWYYLYLRPFSITNQLRMKNPVMSDIQDTFRPGRVETFEALLASALRSRGITLIGLGQPGEAIGVGRFKTTEENWHATFEALAKVATAFIVVPSLHSATHWEIKWLVQNGFINRTVFILPQPPNLQDAKELSAEYSKIRLHFPEDGVASILKLSKDGDEIARVDLNLLWHKRAGEIIQNIKSLEVRAREGVLLAWIDNQ